jgi:putative spermidine/putrescine transport system permease protein
MAFIISFSQYFSTLLIGGGKVKTFMLVMLPYIRSSDRSVASAYALMFLLISFMAFTALRLLSSAERLKWN